jgi:hypothetical protein
MKCMDCWIASNGRFIWNPYIWTHTISACCPCWVSAFSSELAWPIKNTSRTIQGHLFFTVYSSCRALIFIYPRFSSDGSLTLSIYTVWFLIVLLHRWLAVAEEKATQHPLQYSFSQPITVRVLRVSQQKRRQRRRNKTDDI